MTESILTLIWVVALLLGSPGPAPLALAAVGASAGVAKGLPFLFGILAGLLVAIVTTALGLSTLFALYPAIKILVQILGGCYMFYVAYKIASSSVNASAAGNDNVPSFVDGFILNLLNPKAYAAFVAIFSQFTLPTLNSSSSLLLTAVVCFVVAVVVDSLWLALGGLLKPIFNKPRQARLLRLCFAILMVIGVTWVMFTQFN